LEEALSSRATAIKEVQQSAHLTPVALSGPATKGALISIAGKAVQLPPDAFIAGTVSTFGCVVPHPCPQTPIVVLQRGNSTIAVSVPTGAVVSEKVAPGEEAAFDFLQEVLKLKNLSSP
jgi:hypothetical protein